MNINEEIANLLNSQPLYKKVQFKGVYIHHPVDIEDLSFSFYCPTEKSNQTFKLKLEPAKQFEYSGNNLTEEQFRGLFDCYDDQREQRRFYQHYSATCQYCNKYTVHFLLQYKTEAISSNNKSKPIQTIGVLTKIGQFPPYQIKPDHDIMLFLTDEDQDNYKKALICRSQNYGIAAYSYLRRIVENEILRIINNLSTIDRPESNEIRALLEKYEKNKIMTSLIDGIYDYLPSSLKSMGNNPLKVLYNQLSGGIHTFSEEECSAKAENIDILLMFVIKKISEENSLVKAAREAIKNL